RRRRPPRPRASPVSMDQRRARPKLFAMKTPSPRRTADAGGRAMRVPAWIHSPPGHWLLLAVCLSAVMAVLAFQGYVTHTIGPSSEPHVSGDSPAPLAGQRPILTARGARLASAQPPPGPRIALTFDGGPDSEWTPRILAVLREQHVPGTFFVVGSQAARHPDILRRLAASGEQIGNHTFTHV